MKNKSTFLRFFILLMLVIPVIWFCIPRHLFSDPSSHVLLDRNGELLSASIAADGQWRFPSNDQVPDKFVKCITAFEDQRFFSHPGVDLLAITRAFKKNLKAKKIVQGGSTLTMQVIRLSRDNGDRSISEKIIEVLEAVRLECWQQKNEILALYASHAPFGSNVVGLDAAAWRYFGRSAERLSWGEMAALAVLPNAPALVHPGKNIETLLKKRNNLIGKLASMKIIDEQTAFSAKLEPLPGKPLSLPRKAPHFLQRFREYQLQHKQPVALRQTTIDGHLQDRVNEILNDHHGRLKANNIYNACALVLEVETGNVLSYTGNIADFRNPASESYVDVVKSPRSPGSALKPILYAAAFSEGDILPGTLLPDVPTVINGYTPKNFDMEYDGAVPASTALSRSLNIPAVKLLQQYKYQRFYDLLKELGISTLNFPADHYGLSLILGGSEVKMWDLASLYAGLARTVNHQQANRGAALRKDFFEPTFLQHSLKEDTSTDVISSLDATSIWFTFQAMNEVMRPGDESLWQQFSSFQKIAWKTGTSFGFRDAWSIGITPKYVVAVWTGNTSGEGRPGLVGVQTSAPIMFEIFRSLPASDWFKPPAINFRYLPVCRESGFRAGSYCSAVDTIMESKNAYRSPQCPYHRLIHVDAKGNFQVNENCEPSGNITHKSWFVLPPSMEFYFAQSNPSYKQLPPFKAGCAISDFANSMDIIYPDNGAAIYIPVEIDGSPGKTIFSATHRSPGAKIFWHIDNQFIATTSGYHQLALSPPPGKHILTIVDEAGESISRRIEILKPAKN